MNILAIESSCDETSAAVVEKTHSGFKIKSNIVASQIDIHKLYGGVVPEIASRKHIEAISTVCYEAMEKAETGLSDIGLVAVTMNPGLIGALLVGVNFAKALAAANEIPLVGVNHIHGHIAAAYLTEENAPKPPFLALVVSGGHTSIYRVEDYTKIVTIGQTRDDAIGEAFDKIGRILGIAYPAGKEFDALSTKGFIEATGAESGFYNKYKKSEAYKTQDFKLPSPALADGSLDFSFSGLKTAAINLFHKYEQRSMSIPSALFCANYTYTAVEAVAKKIDAAISQNPGCPLVISGGVAANSHLRLRLSELCKKRGVEFFVPPVSLCGDNGAMIAAQGYYEYGTGNIKDASLNASALD